MTSERAPSARAGLDGEYEILRELGIGGTAVVYLARKRTTGEEVAIKLIRAAYLEDEEALARFAREARFASRLDHPNVVPIREVLPLGAGGVALIMDHVSGRTLKQFIRDEGPLSAERAEQVLRDVAAGLGAAHAMDIIHRDVKPENIFIDETGRALLADFGLARSMTGDTQLTMSGVAIGTPTYMPPEQIDGGVIDARGDIYSLGLVAWEMMSGRRPWDGHSLYALLYHQKHDYLPDVRELRPDLLQGRLADVIATAIEKDPAARWQSIDEMVAALDGTAPSRSSSTRPFVSSETIRISRGVVVPEGLGAAVSPYARPGDSVALVPAKAAAQAFIPTAPPPSLPDYEVEVEEERPQNWLLVAGVIALVLLVVALGAGGLHSYLAKHDPRARPATVASSGAANGAVTGPDTTAAPAAATTANGVIPSNAGKRGGSAPPGAAGVVSPAPGVANGAVAIPTPPPALTKKQRADSVAAARARADSAARAKAAASAIGDTRRAESLSPVAAAPRPVVTQRPVAAQPKPAPVVAPPAAPPARVARGTIVAGGLHTCFVGADGRGFCWGANTHGQLGASTSTRAPTPIAIGGGLELTTVAAGFAHSCALARGGAAWCWGENDRGQLGDRSNASHAGPVRVADSRGFRAIATGAAHSCALDTDGLAWCWGAGTHGQLGNGATRDSNVPVAASNQHFASIAAGWNFTCALDAAGHASCWGDNAAGQLGTRDTTDRAQPTPVSGDLTFVAIAAGNGHACGVTAQGDAYCWGGNSAGQLGDGSTSNHLVPSRVKADAHFTSITAGAVHTCAIDNAGQAYCWGMNNFGQLGNGSSQNELQPARVAGARDFASLRAFASHTCGTTVSGEAFCWGYNLEGQLGDGTRMNRSRPVYLEPPMGR